MPRSFRQLIAARIRSRKRSFPLASRPFASISPVICSSLSTSGNRANWSEAIPASLYAISRSNRANQTATGDRRPEHWCRLDTPVGCAVPVADRGRKHCLRSDLFDRQVLPEESQAFQYARCLGGVGALSLSEASAALTRRWQSLGRERSRTSRI